MILIVSNIHWVLTKSRRKLLRMIIVWCIILGLIIERLLNLRLIIVWCYVKGLIIDERLIIEGWIRNAQIIIDEWLSVEWLLIGNVQIIIDKWLIILWVGLLDILIILVDINSLRIGFLISLQQRLV